MIEENSNINTFIKRRFYINNCEESFDACFLMTQFQFLNNQIETEASDTNFLEAQLSFIRYSYAFVTWSLLRQIEEQDNDYLESENTPGLECFGDQIAPFIEIIKDLYRNIFGTIDDYLFEPEYLPNAAAAYDIYPIVRRRDPKYIYRCIRRVNEYLAFQEHDFILHRLGQNPYLREKLKKFINDLMNIEPLQQDVQTYLTKKCIAVATLTHEHKKYYYALSGFDYKQNSSTAIKGNVFEKALALQPFTSKYRRCIATDIMKSWIDSSNNTMREKPLILSNALHQLPTANLKREYSCCERKIFARIEKDFPNYISNKDQITLSIIKPPCPNCTCAIKILRPEINFSSSVEVMPKFR